MASARSAGASPELLAPKTEAARPHVVNLMDALKKSITQVKRPETGRPPRKMAPSKPKPAAARKTRRKTG